jgi:putative methionine-R-sulfoxide reductase with GAF domain
MSPDTSPARQWLRASSEVHKSAVLSIADYALAEIATEARTALGAAGLAIAVAADDGIVCRARAGEAAPEIGTQVEAGRGITGECVTTGAVVRCLDTERDPRVNAAACRALGVRSAVVAPIFRSFGLRVVVGVAEALFTEVNGFNENVVAHLQRIAEEVGSRLYGEPTHDEASAPIDTFQYPHEVVTPTLDEELLPLAAPESAAAADVTEEVPTLETVGELIEDEPLPTLARAAGTKTAATWLGFPIAYAAVGVVALCLAFTVAGFLWSRHVGSGVRADDAWVRLRRAADAGDPTAQYGLALAYRNGSGLPRNPAEAVRLLRQSAEHGNHEAQVELARELENGDGMPRDLLQAYTWYIVAGMAGKDTRDALGRLAPSFSEKQMAQVRFSVGEMLAAGQALPQDLVAAYTWVALADQSGNPDARTSMERVASQLTPQQLATAKARAAGWLRRR